MTKQPNNLYKVAFISQKTGDRLTWYVLSPNIASIEDAIADIVYIAPEQFLDLSNVKEVKDGE